MSIFVRTILQIALLIFAAPIALFFLFYILFVVPRGIYDNYCWRRRLKRAGRYKGSLVHFESIRTGTLIVDSPALGWNVSQCWWTPLDLPSISPEPVPTDEDRDCFLRNNPRELEMPFDRWVYKTFLDSDSGTAILLCTRGGDLLAERIQRTANISVVKCWSGPITLRTSSSVASR